MKEDGGTETGSPYHGVLKAVATFSLTIVDGVTKIVAEQGVVVEDDAVVGAVVNEIPLCYQSICVPWHRTHSQQYRRSRTRSDCLLAKVSEEDIENVDAQFRRRLRIAYREDEGMRLQLDTNHSTNKVQSFKDSWSPLGKEYDTLKSSVGALLVLCPGRVPWNLISPSSTGPGIHIRSHYQTSPWKQFYTANNTEP